MNIFAKLLLVTTTVLAIGCSTNKGLPFLDKTHNALDIQEKRIYTVNVKKDKHVLVDKIDYMNSELQQIRIFSKEAPGKVQLCSKVNLNIKPQSYISQNGNCTKIELGTNSGVVLNLNPKAPATYAKLIIE